MKIGTSACHPTDSFTEKMPNSQHVDTSLEQSRLRLGNSNQERTNATQASDNLKTPRHSRGQKIVSNILLLNVSLLLLFHTFRLVDSNHTHSQHQTRLLAPIISRSEPDEQEYRDSTHQNGANYYIHRSEQEPAAGAAERSAPVRQESFVSLANDARASISLRQVLVPLLTAGHFSRKNNNKRPGSDDDHYEDRWPLVARNDEQDRGRLSSGDHLAMSPNNRGPTNALRLFHARRPPQRSRSLDPHSIFGQRRRQDSGPRLHLVGAGTSQSGGDNDLEPVNTSHASSGPDSLAKGSKLLTKWSQPDPRKSYSLPVSPIRVVSGRPSGGGARRLASAATRRLALSASSLSLSSQQLKRNTPLLEFSATTVPAIMSSTLGSLSTTSSSEQPPTSGELPNRSLADLGELTENDIGSGLDQQQLGGGEQASSSGLDRQPMKSSETQHNENGHQQLIFGGRYQASQLKQQQQQPPPMSPAMVTLIRYLPVSLSVPAEQVAAVVAAQSGPQGAKQLAKMSLMSAQNYADLSAALPSSSTSSQTALLDQLYRYRQQQQQQNGDHALATSKQQPLVAPKYHIIDTLLPGGDPNVSSQPMAKQAVLLDKHNQLGGSSGADINSDYSQLYPSSLSSNPPAGTATAISLDGQPAGSLAMLLASASPVADGAHPSPALTRLAYLPVGPPTQLAMPMGHAASKAISAYASKLISMLRPSTLLSTIGSSSTPQSSTTGQPSGYFANQQARNHPLPHIYLLAPAETIVPPAATLTGQGLVRSANKPASRQQSPQQVSPQSGAIQQLHEDVLMNQASKVHSTKSRERQTTTSDQQQQQRQEVRWPLAPQMNGLVCIQGIIGTRSAAKQTTSQPQPLQQQQQPMISQAQMQDDDMGSFDYERPKGDAQLGMGTTMAVGEQRQQQQQTAASTGYQGQTKSGKGSASGKGVSVKRERSRESPIRLAQKFSKKQYNQQDQPGRSSHSYGYTSNQDQQQPITQQKLMSLSSDENNSILDANQESKQQQQQHKMVAPVDQDVETRRSIIPFTIQDKIDAPSSRAWAHQKRHQSHLLPPSTTTSAPSQTNGPVQYDEPPEIDSSTASSMSSKLNLSSDSDQRRSRTSFAASSPLSSSRQQPKQQQQPQQARQGQYNSATPPKSVEIDYKKETSGANQDNQRNDYSLPVLMASSTPTRNIAGPPARSPHDNQHHPTGSAIYSRSASMGHSGAVRPSSSLVVSSHELMGSPSSASSVSTTTTANYLARSTTAPPTTASPPTSISGHERSSQSSSSSSPSAGTNLGQLISSISLTRESNEETGDTNEDDGRRGRSRTANSRKSSGGRSQMTGSSNDTMTTATRGNNGATIELIVNSTPREQQSGGGNMDGGRTNVLSSPTNNHFVTQNITASPLYLQQQQQQTDSTTQTPINQSSDTGYDQRRQHGHQSADPDSPSHSTNTYSHDRTLSSAGSTDGSSSTGPFGQFGKISESLQTNPLDLIDLQNSRSSFELPSQLESLSMFYSDANRASQQTTSAKAGANPHLVDTLNPAETSGDERRHPVAGDTDKHTPDVEPEQDGDATAAATTTTTTTAATATRPKSSTGVSRKSDKISSLSVSDE